MNTDGSAMRAVTSRGLDERASYLPDGRILYYRGSSHVWVVANPDGTHIRSTGIHQHRASLCVLANGNRIALRRNPKVNASLSALFVGRLFGGRDRLKRITRYQRMDLTIDCSPDGTRILFTSPDAGTPKSANVFSVRTDGSLVQLTRSQGARSTTPPLRGRRTGRRSSSPLPEPQQALRDERGRHGLDQVTHIRWVGAAVWAAIADSASEPAKRLSDPYVPARGTRRLTLPELHGEGRLKPCPSIRR
jgi:hypothetical protein